MRPSTWALCTHEQEVPLSAWRSGWLLAVATAIMATTGCDAKSRSRVETKVRKALNVRRASGPTTPDRKPVIVHGRVTGHGQPVAGIRICAQPLGGKSPQSFCDNTDLEGRYAIYATETAAERVQVSGAAMSTRDGSGRFADRKFKTDWYTTQLPITVPIELRPAHKTGEIKQASP